VHRHEGRGIPSSSVLMTSDAKNRGPTVMLTSVTCSHHPSFLGFRVFDARQRMSNKVGRTIRHLVCHLAGYVIFMGGESTQGWGGIEYPSPYATAWRKWRPDGAPQDHIWCGVFLEGCPCDDAPYPRPYGRCSVPHRLQD
jgi:hypothetical protein